MAKKPTVTTLQSGFNSTEVLNSNFENLRDAFDNTLSLDGSTPNAMDADLDLNGNDILNAGTILINGVDYLAAAQAAQAARAARAEVGSPGKQAARHARRQPGSSNSIRQQQAHDYQTNTVQPAFGALAT